MRESATPDRRANDPLHLFHVEQLDRLCALVRRWNNVIRLVSPTDIAVLESRHVANSLTLRPLIEQLNPRTIIDVGSGGGFPGLVVAVVTGLPTHLVEANRRKAEFLREAARHLRVAVTVHAARAETLGIRADLVIARAVAPFPALWNMTRTLLTPQGTALFLKGDAAANEIRNLQAAALLWLLPGGTVVEMRN